MLADPNTSSRHGRGPRRRRRVRRFASLALLATVGLAGSGSKGQGTESATPDRVEPGTGMAFAALPAGCFEMGDLDAGLIGRVCLDRFAIGRREVTNAQFRRYMPDHRSGWFAGDSLDGDDQPVVSVSWSDASAFATWLSVRSGRRFRLPTEAEWEHAARAGTTTAWPWGASEEVANRYANLRYSHGGPVPADPFRVTAPVGSLEPNAWGLHDMIGNASEWVADGYLPGADRYGDQTRNPVVPPTGPMRVRRGGSFDDPLRLARAGARDFYAAGLGVPQTGFRLVMEDP